MLARVKDSRTACSCVYTDWNATLQVATRRGPKPLQPCSGDHRGSHLQLRARGSHNEGRNFTPSTRTLELVDYLRKNRSALTGRH